MPEESNATTDTGEASTKAASGKKGSPRKGASKPKVKKSTVKKSTTKKKIPKKSASKKSGSKKGAAKKAAGGARRTDARRGKPPLKALRVLLLDEERPGRSGAEVAREVACVPNFVYNVRAERKERGYDKLIEALSAEQRQKLLTERIPLKGEATQRPAAAKPKPVPSEKRDGGQASELGARNGSPAQVGNRIPAVSGTPDVEFRRALRNVGLNRARQLLEAFEREE